ncbi:MAG TPA: hypothetical protein VHB30_00485 [Solirubrobacteraceae bacterium]|jgi:hypothetical protein|nr:hypothetical protein [Solirubrobacteraceae bacterium]
MSPEPCNWCDAPVGRDEGFRASRPGVGERAVFCRLEHVVPWLLRGASWEAGSGLEPGDDDAGLGRCALCGERLGEERVLLVRHRGAHRIADGFCGTEHMLTWAKSGGRWA